MSMLDFNNLPPSNEVLGIIAEMTLDDVLANLNAARTMALALPAGGSGVAGTTEGQHHAGSAGS